MLGTWLDEFTGVYAELEHLDLSDGAGTYRHRLSGVDTHPTDC